MQNITFPHCRFAAIRLMGRVTALALRHCTFSGRKTDDSGNNDIHFIRADPNLTVDEGVRIQDSHFSHSATEAILPDGRGDWEIGENVTFHDCGGEVSPRASFRGNLRKK